MRLRLSLLGLLGIAAACSPGNGSPGAPPSENISQRVGPGFYLTKAPLDLDLPGNKERRAVSPKVTADFKGPPTSNDWWSSLIWQYDTWGNNPHSGPLYAHPLTLKAESTGLGLRYPTRPEVSQYQYMYWQDKDLLVGLEGLAAKATRVAGYSDWAVTASWQSGGSELRATMGHGFPFVYFTRTGTAAAQISLQREAWDKTRLEVSVWHEGGEWLGLGVADRSYVVFGPSGSEWKRDGDIFTSDLAGKDFFSVAALPERDAATVELFRTHAYAFVTDTRVSGRTPTPTPGSP